MRYRAYRVRGTGYTEWVYRMGIQTGYTDWVYRMGIQMGYTDWVYRLGIQNGYIHVACSFSMFILNNLIGWQVGWVYKHEKIV